MNTVLTDQLHREIARCAFDCEVAVFAADQAERWLGVSRGFQSETVKYFKDCAAEHSRRAFELAMSLAREAE